MNRLKSFPHIISKLFYEPLVITKAKHSAIVRVLDSKMRSEVPGLPAEDDYEEEEPDYEQAGSTAIIKVQGILGKHLEPLAMASGGCDVDTVGAALDLAVEDDSVTKILFHFITPGGEVTGIPELANKIANCPKETIGFYDSECCSGGEWLKSQCRRAYCTSSATGGSIGVWCAYEDWSRYLSNEGVNVQAIEAGKYKTMGAYWKPLTAEEIGMIQKQVDKIHTQFKAAVNRYREIGDQFMQGQCFDGQEAVEIGLVDGLVQDIEELLEEA